MLSFEKACFEDRFPKILDTYYEEEGEESTLETSGEDRRTPPKTSVFSDFQNLRMGISQFS